ncbi:MAG: MBL fold metallo-hydrolase [Planctomycetes bacterium]|nr:MBL fold metallo-hydrolase [Planctomycetota bacterium]
MNEERFLPLSRAKRRLIVGIVLLTFVPVLCYLWFKERLGDPDLLASVPALGPVPVTVVPGVHLLGGLAPAAAYVIESSRGLILIDAGLERDASVLKAQLAALGLDWKRLQAIFLTHMHPDHSGGAEHLRELTGAIIHAGGGDVDVLLSPPLHTPDEQLIAHWPSHSTKVNVRLRQDQTIVIGGVRIHALTTPGHSPGSMCYLVERGQLRILFSGDVIMTLGGPKVSKSKLTRPLGTYTAYLSPFLGGSAQGFLNTFRKLAALPPPDLVLPGHPRMDQTYRRPAMSQERWRALLDDGIREMDRLLARLSRDGALFLDGAPRQVLPGMYYLGDFHGHPVPTWFAGSRLHLIDAPGGPGLGDFVRSRLAQLGASPELPDVVMLTSCAPEAMAGLGELLAQGGSSVVVGKAGIETVKGLCPRKTVIQAAEELRGDEWSAVTAIALPAPGPASIAYLVRCDKKQVLFSGRAPAPLNNRLAIKRLVGERDARQNDFALRAALDLLAAHRPDVWLPAASLLGFNALLYDDDWQELIEENRRFIK